PAERGRVPLDAAEAGEPGELVLAAVEPEPPVAAAGNGALGEQWTHHACRAEAALDARDGRADGGFLPPELLLHADDAESRGRLDLHVTERAGQDEAAGGFPRRDGGQGPDGQA